MNNRFKNAKSLRDLYNVFASEEGMDDFYNLTNEELERVAVVFEANLPFNTVLPVIPLNEKGYVYIWNVVIEEVETEPTYIADEEVLEEVAVEENEEDDIMENIAVNETAATTEEVTMGQKAKTFAENAKEKLVEGFQFAVENVDGVAEEVKKMANMNDAQLEQHLTNKGKSVLDKIIKAVKGFADEAQEDAVRFPMFKESCSRDVSRANNIIALIEDVLDKKELSGWGKFKAIVKELIKWLLRLLLKVGAIVLKLAITVAVGAIKIGATAVVTTGKVAGILNKEVFKPTIKAGKNAWNTHKANKAQKAKADEFKEVREALFGVDEDAE